MVPSPAIIIAVTSLLAQMRRDPVVSSAGEWLLLTAGATVFAGLAIEFLIPLPSAALVRDTTNVGVVLVLAYVLEAAWLTKHLSTDDYYADTFGVILAIGIGGMIGVVVSMLVTAHRAAGHGNLLDAFGYGWAVVSLLALAAMIALHPLLVRVWEGKQSDA